MLNLFQMAVIVMGVAITLGLLVLVRTHLKLRQEYRVLAETLSASRNDVAGLCSAALVVNSRITASEALLSELSATLEEIQRTNTDKQQQAESSDTSYSAVIQKVRSGASVNELMHNCGLSRDEAALLIRLHGSSGNL